jgi:cold shock CspA family protein
MLGNGRSDSRFSRAAWPLTTGGDVEGLIKAVIEDRGFGFIGVHGQSDVFFHVSELEDGYDPLRNDKVKFDLGQDTRGRVCAKDIRRA